MFSPAALLVRSGRAMRETLLRHKKPQPPETREPAALYRDLIFEVFETGIDITYHDVSKPRPKNTPSPGTYMADPIYDAPMDMYRLLDGDRHRYLTKREYQERMTCRMAPPHWIEVELRHTPTGAFLRHRRREGSGIDTGTYTVGHAGGSETVTGEATKQAQRYFAEHWDREGKKAEERAEAARMERVRSFLPKFEAWLAQPLN